MNEDLKPLYDIESCWETAVSEAPYLLISKHKDYPHLFRIIDYKEREIRFRDTLYVKPEGIIDIYRPLADAEKKTVRGLILGIMYEIRPIFMPYIPVSYKVYIEYHWNAVGILYFMDVDEDKTMVPIKRFFAIKRDPVLSFDEINWSMFRKLAEEVEKEDENDK